MGSDVVEITSGAGAITSDRVRVTFVFAESVTVTETVEVPSVAGVPLIAPPADTLKSGGSPAADQVYGGTPPMAASCAEYPAPTCPFGSEDVVMVRGAAVTRIVKDFDALAPSVSVTVTENVNVPVAVSDPASVPSLENVAPEGSEPLAVKTYGGTPPVAPNLMPIVDPTALSLTVPVTTRGPGTITRTKSLVAVPPAASVTLAVNNDCPGVVGVPTMRPVSVSDRPAGRLPPASEKV